MSETADILDGAFWDFDPEADLLSPLVTTDRYFRDFPWEPEPRADPRPGSAGVGSIPGGAPGPAAEGDEDRGQQ